MKRPSPATQECENLNRGVVHWGRLVHPKDGHEKVFCVLHAYLDDSGTHNGARVCTVAGYFGSEKQWIKFDRDWRSALNEEHLDEFHANRFWSSFKGRPVTEYKGWDSERSKKFIFRLLEILGS